MMDTRQKALPSYAVDFVTKEWIGVGQNGLQEFTRPSLTSFLLYLDLPVSHPGVDENTLLQDGSAASKRQRFALALHHGTPEQQIAILEGVLERVSIDPTLGRTPEKADRIRAWIDDLRQSQPFGNVALDGIKASIPEVAAEVLRVADDHMKRREFHLAVDRLHTALHACVKQLAGEVDCDTEQKQTLSKQFRAVRQRHPAFRVEQGERALADIMRGLFKVIEGVNAARNNNSFAHPPDQILPLPEAHLFCNAGITVLQYILDRVESESSQVQGAMGSTVDDYPAAQVASLNKPLAPFDVGSEEHWFDANGDLPFE